MNNNSQLAFPCPNDANVNGDIGLTKREWFAGMALQGMINAGYNQPEDAIARQAFVYADEMIGASQS